MTRLLAIVLCIVLLGYGLFEARRIIEGPTITLTSLKDGAATSTNMLVVSGTAHNISFLTIDDKPAYTDEAGHFSLTLSPPVGYTVVTVAAKDRFGRQARKSVFITVLSYCPVQTGQV